jgi:hypothetical protein
MKLQLTLAAGLLLMMSTPASVAEKTRVDKIAERTAKAEREEPHKRGKPYSEIAIEYSRLASERFQANDPDGGQNAVAHALEFAHKAAESAKLKRKDIKRTEINLRDCVGRLEDLARMVSLLEREKIEPTAKEIDKLRSELLDAMFSKR